MRLEDVSPRSILRLPHASPVRRMAVQLAARDAIEQREHRCGCGERYMAVGRPATFHDGQVGDFLPGPERLVCRNPRCRAVL